MNSLDLQAQEKDSLAVMKAATTFIEAFNNFDWATFRSSFTEDATIFYPFWGQAKRVAGRKDVEATWLKLFPEFADPKNTRKQQIDPNNILIQLYGQTAIVTFHLGNGVERLSRRTLVMVKSKNKWKIAHLHASSLNAN